MGLSIMQYRASMIAASLDFKVHPQGGTDVVCCFQIRDGF
jgi:nitrate/nitrite-specific signal transduction histidine kinase